MKILFNYAHLQYLNAQKLNTKTGYEIGKFDKVFQFGFKDIDVEFYNKYKHILDQPRGAGYWLWKYYFAKKLLIDENIPEGSYIFYSDAGGQFIDTIDNIISIMNRDKISIMTFRTCHMSYIWIKRDAFILMNADESIYTHTAGRCGGFWMVRKDNESRKFIDECYNYSLDYRIITDSPNELGVENYDGFIRNSHDEAILSIVSKKWKLFPYRVPTQWGYIGDVNLTNNMYGEVGFKIMVEKFGHPSTWGNKYGCYFHGESLEQYPSINIDDKSTYPTIIELVKNRY